MRYPASEKLEIIRIVEQSHLPAKRTLDQLGIPRRTFYRWYDRYLEGGPEALEDRPSALSFATKTNSEISPDSTLSAQSRILAASSRLFSIFASLMLAIFSVIALSFYLFLSALSFTQIAKMAQAGPCCRFGDA